jgi:excisionase family DNA binding protein
MSMALADLRQELEAVRAEAAQARNKGVVEKLDRILAELDDELLLTTKEAARLLSIGSVNTIKAMIHNGQIQARKVGTHYRIPLSEVERLRQDSTIRGLQASSQIHAEIAALGATEGLTRQELDDLEESRPGTVPWERPTAARP